MSQRREGDILDADDTDASAKRTVDNSEEGSARRAEDTKAGHGEAEASGVEPVETGDAQAQECEALRRERDKRHGQRKAAGRCCIMLEIDHSIVGLLVSDGWLRERDADDMRAVRRAFEQAAAEGAISFRPRGR